jgi:hypothetical protein
MLLIFFPNNVINFFASARQGLKVSTENGRKQKREKSSLYLFLLASSPKRAASPAFLLVKGI